jgi:flagellar motor switch protein FliG
MICTLCKKKSKKYRFIEVKKQWIYICEDCVVEAGILSIKNAYEKLMAKFFVFEDILKLDLCAMKLVVRRVEMKNWAIALKDSSKEMMEHIENCMSSGQFQILKDEIGYLGSLRQKEAEEVKGWIVDVVVELERKGEIIIRRHGDKEIIV